MQDDLLTLTLSQNTVDFDVLPDLPDVTIAIIISMYQQQRDCASARLSLLVSAMQRAQRESRDDQLLMLKLLENRLFLLSDNYFAVSAS